MVSKINPTFLHFKFAFLWNNQFYNNLGLKYRSSKFLSQRRRELFFRWSMPNLLQGMFLWMVIIVLQRNKCLFIFSALPEEWKTLHVLVLVTIGEFLFAFSYHMTVIVMFYIAYTYLMSSKFWLNHIW